jgi:hypothetical protein
VRPGEYARALFGPEKPAVSVEVGGDGIDRPAQGSQNRLGFRVPGFPIHTEDGSGLKIVRWQKSDAGHLKPACGIQSKTGRGVGDRQGLEHCA